MFQFPPNLPSFLIIPYEQSIFECDSHQRRTFTAMLDARIRSSLDKISSDSLSGAEALTNKSAELFRWIAENVQLQDSHEFLEIILETSKALVNAQPAMSGIFNLTNKILLATNAMDDVLKIRSTVTEKADEIKRLSEEHLELIANQASKVIHPGDTIVTHSFSSTVFQSLEMARKSGKDFSVICTESRPLLEGISLARKLGESGIRVTLVTDSGVFAMIEHADLVLLGADAFSLDGLINKAGSSAIAMMAQRYHVPCYALCSSLKFLPSGHKMPSNKTGDVREILVDAAANITPMNFYFDLTPFECLTGVITEQGEQSWEAIKEKIASMKIHPFLR